MRPFANSPIWKWIDSIGDKTAIDPSKIKPLLSIAITKPIHYNIGHGDQDSSLYWNAPFFFRIMLPFYIGFMVRWSGCTDCRAFLQTGIGWKLNGRLALTLRIQSDTSGESGMDFPNPGQAKGWEYGGK